MTEDTNQEAGGVTLGDLYARLEDLTREVRRQGRAAVAAQAAAESCLERLAEGSAESAEHPENERHDLGWVESILPVADALDRVLAQASAMGDRPSRHATPKRGGLWSVLTRASHDGEPPSNDAEIRAVAEGLRVLRAQLATALETCGVTADRRVGVPIDPEVHRVVEVRAPRSGERDGVVLEVIRPGYAANGHVVREAEVVAAGRP